MDRNEFFDLLMNDAFRSIDEQWVSRECLGFPTHKDSYKIIELLVGC